MRISELSKLSGFSKDTIRFYEKIGLIALPDAGRNKYEYKDYPETILKRLHTIRKIKDYGFTLHETQGLLFLYETGVLEPARGLRYLQKKIARVDDQIIKLLTVKARLQSIVDENCSEHCPIGRILYQL